MSDPEQPTLFDLPAPLRRPAKMSTPRAAGRVTYTKFTPAQRRICDDCVRDIHARGIDVAPYPSGVRWRRTAADGVDLLCQRHKDLRMGSDV